MPIYFLLMVLWNELEDDSIKISTTKSEFNTKLKSHFLNSLNENYICFRLLCPNCHFNDNANFIPDA
jgi:hypothetical protein